MFGVRRPQPGQRLGEPPGLFNLTSHGKNAARDVFPLMLKELA